MPNYQKCANTLFKQEAHSSIDNSTGALKLVHSMGQTFVAVKDKDLPQPKAVQRMQQFAQTLKQDVKVEEKTDKVDKKSLPSLVKTRKRIIIEKKTHPRSVDGVQTSSDSTYKGVYKQPKFFEQVADAPRQIRNATHFSHQFSVADGYPKDVWESSAHAAHTYIPESYPDGYMTNQGIQAMYTTFAKSGKITGGCDLRRTCQGIK
ncbi:Conserved_hypothetical protein [Hexamita inflata]|uniref:Uncharacterized protein n=1 Tax=Hexamita inflata TaxID=28002 RepID=A0AA86NV78_9EUKA|nr:Conserved hypothetical protein [Hexamita inflata]CAI9928746.1 Conserved hypothetical protein [Hexamita inflata]